MSDFIWVEKYRPQQIDECILPDHIKKTFQDFVDQGEIPNMLLSGPPGIGKTTVAKALCKQLGVDYYVTKRQHHSHLQVLMSLNITQGMTLLLLTNVISHPNLGLHLIIFVTHPKNQIGYEAHSI